MKTFYLFFLVVFFLFSFRLSAITDDVRLESVTTWRFTNSSGSFSQSAQQSSNINVTGSEIEQYILAYSFRNVVGFSCPTGNVSPLPSLSAALVDSGVSLSSPFKVSTNGVIKTTGWGFAAPHVHALYSTLARLYLSGYRNYVNIYVGSSSVYLNFVPNSVIADILGGTNTLWRSSVLSALSNIDNTLSGINTSIQNINVDLGQFQTDYQSVNSLALNPSSFSYSSMPNIGGPPYYNYAVESVLQSPYYSNSFKSLLASSLGSSYSDYLIDAAQMYQLDQMSPGSPGYGKSFNDYLNSPVSAAASRNYHMSTPLTNELRRMSLDWSRDTTNQLARNTANTTNQLQQWKRELHDDVDNIGCALGSVITDNGGQNSLRVDIVGAGDVFNSVSIDGDITIAGTQWSTIGDGFDNVEGKLDGILNEFQNWAWEDPLGWSKYFVNFYSLHSLSNQAAEISLLSSITNILHDFTFNFTNNTEFAISNALAGFTFSSTNDYLLLTDYADYISTSGLSDLLGFLDDDSYSDLKVELSSIGSDDVSEGYGRWWRYYTGLSTIQANSVFKIANLLIDHEKLLKDLKRENTDVVELSDFNVFSELLTKIPSQTHIDNKISELTNSIDQSGFVRIRELIPDLTNRLSVASALYDHNFALPTDISFVLIPSDYDLKIKERVVHISPYDHYRVFQVLHYGIAFSYCIVNLILLPKFLLLLVRLFDRVWNKSERLIYNSTQS